MTEQKAEKAPEVIEISRSQPVTMSSEEVVDTNGPDDDEEENLYSVILLNGIVTYHYDSRDPWQVEADFKFSQAFPVLPNSGGKGPALSDEEWEYLGQLKSEDPKRFARKDARIYAFSLGDRVFNPGQIASVGPAADMMQPDSEELVQQFMIESDREPAERIPTDGRSALASMLSGKK